MLATSLLMLATGIGFAAASGFWPVLLIALLGTLNPSAGDVSVFLPLEQTALSGAIADRDRTDLFARYSLMGSLFGAGGALLAIVPDHVAGLAGAESPRPSFCSTAGGAQLRGDGRPVITRPTGRVVGRFLAEIIPGVMISRT